MIHKMRTTTRRDLIKKKHGNNKKIVDTTRSIIAITRSIISKTTMRRYEVDTTRGMITTRR